MTDCINIDIRGIIPKIGVVLDRIPFMEKVGRREAVRSQSNLDQGERLLQEYGNAIYRLAYSYLKNAADAEDMVQETLIRYLQNRPGFELPGQEKAWILQVAANLSKNRIRYHHVRQEEPLSDMLAAEGKEDLSFVWDAVKKLPESQRTTIHLFYYEGYSTCEIAGILKRKESTVRSDLRRGRIRLKELLKEEYDFG